MARRIWCVLLALCVLLLSCGCSGEPELPDTTTPTQQTPADSIPEEELTFALAYSYDDTLNPFAATTEVNLWLAPLLYDSLTVITEGYVPQLSLAKEIATPDATHLVVTLREGAVFSDGSAVTGNDVVKSFQAAQQSPHYAALLTNVTAAKVDSAVQKLLNQCYSETVAMLRENRPLLDEISEFLLAKETITGEELMSFVNKSKEPTEQPAETE